MIGPRSRVLRELVTAGVLAYVTRWQPVLAGWLLSTAALTWKADDVHDPAGMATLLRIIVVLVVTSVVYLVDDAAANVLAPVPLPLAWRYGVRFGLAAAAVALPWVAALLWVNPGHLAAGLTLECVAMTTFALAVASGIARWSDTHDAGAAAGPAVLSTAVLADFLPPRWAMFAPPGDGWRDAHLRWTAELGLRTEPALERR